MDKNSIVDALKNRGQKIDSWADEYMKPENEGKENFLARLGIGTSKLIGDRITKPISYIQNTGGFGQAYTDLINPTPAEKFGMQTQNINEKISDAKSNVAESLSRLGQSQGALNDLISQVKANQAGQDNQARAYAQSH